MLHLVHESEYRGEEIVAARGSAKIICCGAGAIGSNLLDLLAVQGYHALVVIDKDRVESGNLGTQAYTPADAGRMKASQLSAFIFRKLKVKVEAIDTELKSSNVKKLLSGAKLVIDAFDNACSRNLVQDFCKKSSIPCLHIGMSVDGFAEIEWNENYHAHEPPPGEHAPCDYPLAVNLVKFTVAMAAEVINSFIDYGKKRAIHFTLKDMRVIENARR